METEYLARIENRFSQLADQLGGKTLDESYLAAVCVAYDAQPFVAKTLLELAAQTSALYERTDIFLILNDGGGNTRDFLLSGPDRLELESSFDEIVHLTESSAREWRQRSSKAQSRLIVIDQGGSSPSRGKAHGLKFILEFLFDGVLSESYPYGQIFLFDAESRLRKVGREGSPFKIRENEPRGLAELKAAVGNSTPLVGSRFLMTHYDEAGNPEWDGDIQGPSYVSNILIASGASDLLNGGAILGRSREVLPLYLSGLSVFPACRVEDSMVSLLARKTGKDFKILREVVHSNHCSRQPAAANSQFLRWIKGNRALRSSLTTELFYSLKVFRTPFQRAFLIALFWFRCPDYVKPVKLWKAVREGLKLEKMAENEPDDLINGAAFW